VKEFSERKIRLKCAICGRKLTRRDLTKTRGELKPLYVYISEELEVKPICTGCYHTISGRRLIRKARKELKPLIREFAK